MKFSIEVSCGMENFVLVQWLLSSEYKTNTNFALFFADNFRQLHVRYIFSEKL